MVFGVLGPEAPFGISGLEGLRDLFKGWTGSQFQPTFIWQEIITYEKIILKQLLSKNYEFQA